MMDPLLAWDEHGLLLLSQLTRQPRRPQCPCDRAGERDHRCRLYCRRQTRLDHAADNVPLRNQEITR